LPIEHFDWKRFWCPAGTQIGLQDGGYLPDPDSPFGPAYNPQVVPFAAIASIPCLALLGEPGIGKTSAIEEEQETIDSAIRAAGGQTLRLNLRSYGSEDRLVRRLFEGEEFKVWVAGSHRLHLFLDSLDECLLKISTVASLLIDELRPYKTLARERMYLRIACRTAEWPSSLAGGLSDLWGEERVCAYELAPLRRRDVAEAARMRRLDIDGLLSAIDEREAVPLAIKPITLKFLLNAYERERAFPATQEALYREGCRVLCEETNKDRRAAGLVGVLDAEHRLKLAERIAAITVFGNRGAIKTGFDLGDLGDLDTSDVTVAELTRGGEPVSEAAIRETLDTGLFSSRGLERIGWAHQTYAEFLAARFVAGSGMRLPQVLSLLIHPGDPEWKLVPQLHETAAWLAGMVPGVYHEILRTDPEVLLRSDVAVANPADRAALVIALLSSFETGRLQLDYGVSHLYRKLSHPTLLGQLLPYIGDGSKSDTLRYQAINIAEACELRMLQGDLVDIALDASQSDATRARAAAFVSRIGDSESRCRLRSLVDGAVGTDASDDLKGWALRALWPDQLSADELLGMLAIPKRPNYTGPYAWFLSHELASHLRAPDLPAALKWSAAQPLSRRMPYPFSKLVEAIMRLAWANVSAPGILESLAATLLVLSRRHDPILADLLDLTEGAAILDDTATRRSLIEAMLPHCSDPANDTFVFLHPRSALIRQDDLWWLQQRVLQAAGAEAAIIARLIHFVADLSDMDQVASIHDAIQNCDAMRDEFGPLFQPIGLGSPQAQMMRDQHERMLQLEERRKPVVLDPSPSQRITLLLAECESGNSAAWWQLNMAMTLAPHSTHYGNEYESDLTALPGWSEADGATKARIVKAAERYLHEQDPQTDTWLGTNTLDRPAFAGYRALRLLQTEVPRALNALPRHIWQKWAPIVVAYPTPHGVGDESPHLALTALAYRHSPDEVVRVLRAVMDQEAGENGHIFVNRKFGPCWDDRLAQVLLEKARERDLPFTCMGSLLADLLRHNDPFARAFAESLITTQPRLDCGHLGRSVVAAQTLFQLAPDAGWSVVWPAIKNDPDFGRLVLPRVAHRPLQEAASFESRLSVEQVSDLYMWLVRQFPPEQDPKFEGARFVGPRDSIARWRDLLVHQLSNRGTNEACTALRRIMRELPELPWIQRLLPAADARARARTWIPFRPEEVLNLARRPESRLVQNGEQLLEAIVESVQRFEAKLQGETPLAFALWNEDSQGKGRKRYWPKHEERLSDFVKWHLQDDLVGRGIVLNREVVIRGGGPPAAGERTDIHVDAVVPQCGQGPYDRVTVIIETKGCWHSELKTAMKAQLVDRYLDDNACQHGVYLVGWYHCAQWDDGDYRKADVPFASREEAEMYLRNQAKDLSSDGMMIQAVVIDARFR